MAYEWKVNPRPYSDDEAKDLLGKVVSPETTDWHYNKHHKGYVAALNTIEKGLEKADAASANGNYLAERGSAASNSSAPAARPRSARPGDWGSSRSRGPNRTRLHRPH